MTDTTPNVLFRKIPSLDSLLREDAVRALVEEFGRDVTVAEGRAVLDEARAVIATASADTATPTADISPDYLVARLRSRLEKKFAPSLSPAVNATGIIMHSGLGRAVLSEAAREALSAVSLGYSTLALDLESGKRVSRDRHVEGLLRELTGAEAVTVANNNAAATVLVLNTLARGRVLEGLEKLGGTSRDAVEQMFVQSGGAPQGVREIALKLGRGEPEVAAAVAGLLADAPTLKLVLDELIDKKVLFRKDAEIGLAGREAKSNPVEDELRARVEGVFRSARFAVPLEEDVRTKLVLNPSFFNSILNGLLRDGRLVRLAPKVTYHRDTLEAARQAVAALIERRGSVTIAELRDRLDLSRKYAQAILEYFDRTGFTKRIEDRHVLILTKS